MAPGHTHHLDNLDGIAFAFIRNNFSNIGWISVAGTQGISINDENGAPAGSIPVLLPRKYADTIGYSAYDSEVFVEDNVNGPFSTKCSVEGQTWGIRDPSTPFIHPGIPGFTV